MFKDIKVGLIRNHNYVTQLFKDIKIRKKGIIHSKNMLILMKRIYLIVAF